jgi:hypothetical protein
LPGVNLNVKAGFLDLELQPFAIAAIDANPDFLHPL